MIQFIVRAYYFLLKRSFYGIFFLKKNDFFHVKVVSWEPSESAINKAVFLTLEGHESVWLSILRGLLSYSYDAKVLKDVIPKIRLNKTVYNGQVKIKSILVLIF